MLDFSHLVLAFFLPACFAMNLSPGPRNAAAFVVGARHGGQTGMLSVLGRLPAQAILIALVAIGLDTALAASGAALWWVKMIGALYLIYVGVKIWRAAAQEPKMVGGAGWAQLARREFAIAVTNPKAIAIFTAFFPQFVDPGAAVAPQILAMGAIFLGLELLAAWIYVLVGMAAGGALRRSNGAALLQKGIGGFLIFSGAGLAVSNR